MNNKYLLLSVAFIATAISLRLASPSEKHPAMDRRERENKSVALDALQFTTMAAAYPNKDIPADAYVSAQNWYKNNSAANQRTENATSWISMGPTNMGGRTVSFAMDPTDTATIWLGAASGGLWKSTTGGIGAAAWTYVPITGFQVLGVGSIAINPNNHLEMYVGTGEVYSDSSFSQGIISLRPTRGSYGMGLFKTTDGGSTWSQCLNWTYQQNRGIWSIVINPLKSTTVYAGTTDGIWKSYDAGATWTQVLNVPMCMDLMMHAVDTNILLCGVGNYGSTLHGIYRTTNSGATWTALSSANLPPLNSNSGRITLTKFVGNNDIMYAHICDVYNSIGIYKSTDKGATWTQVYNQDIASYQGWYAKGMCINSSNSNDILAGGVDVFGSTNGGASFSDVSQNSWVFHTDVHGIYENPKVANQIYILTDGGLFRSNDWGNTYFDCNGGYNTTQSYIGSISATNNTVLLSGLQDNYTIKYFGSNQWQGVVGGDGCFNAIDHTNDQIEYGAYQYLNVYACNDQGMFNSAWQILSNSQNASGPNYGAFLAPYILCYSNTQYIYACGQALQLSTDGGNTWNYMGNNPVNNNAWIMAIAASHTNTDSIYFCTAPDSVNNFKMFFSANRGTTVTNITAGLPNRYPRRIAVNPSNSKEVYIVFSGFGGQHVFRSKNSGVTWTDISGSLPDMPFECITADPLFPGSMLYAGCDYGVFYSNDDGNTWNSYDNGFPDATEVFDIVVSPSDRNLYAFTHGRGVFHRDLSDITGMQVLSKTAANIKVYPNPASDELHISTGGNTNDRCTASLYDMNGKMVQSAEFVGATGIVNVSNLTIGTYIVNVTKNGSAFAIQKFIKE